MWAEIVGGVMGSVSGSGGSAASMGGGAHETGAQQNAAIFGDNRNAGINFGPGEAAMQQQSYMQLALIGGLVLVAFIALGKK